MSTRGHAPACSCPRPPPMVNEGRREDPPSQPAAVPFHIRTCSLGSNSRSRSRTNSSGRPLQSSLPRPSTYLQSLMAAVNIIPPLPPLPPPVVIVIVKRSTTLRGNKFSMLLRSHPCQRSCTQCSSHKSCTPHNPGGGCSRTHKPSPLQRHQPRTLSLPPRPMLQCPPPGSRELAHVPCPISSPPRPARPTPVRDSCIAPCRRDVS
jgi:hypothetical protein